MTLKQRITLILGLDSLVGIALVVTKLTGLNSSYLNGFGIGLFSVTVPFLIYLTFKLRDREYREEYDLSVNDERIRRNSEKAYAIGFQIQTALLLATAVISYVADFNLYFPVIAIVLASLIFAKVYYKRLNKQPD
ncbi:hypothetical protein [Spirochaeta isovalerica]|uniref:Putative membrane protein n=1 Tax=Spirochaeta isovalerica TaxID=150 RepID=A0A841R7U4_9SPIO|nr:hypothetical protein [Spirochaeta isovalerica]MBB6479896.1 putative membrane protein [Spirochaeta isovalerica]